jgi:hypothetical protein
MAERRYSLRVGMIRSSARSSVIVACATFAVSCARSTPPPELPISAHVMVSRVISEDVPSRPSDCAIETLATLPTQSYRELGTIEISAVDPARHDTRVIIDQHACAMGADAVLIGPAPSQGGRIEATAIAYASGLANRVAKLRAAQEAAASPPPPIPKSRVPEAEEIPPAGSPQSSAAAADDSEAELPPQTQVPIGEQQIGPAEAPSPAPATTPSVTPVTPSAAQPAAASTSPTSATPTAGAELSTASAPIPAASTPAGSARAPLISSASTPQSPAQISTPIPTRAGVLPPAPATTLPPAPIVPLSP